MENMIEVARIKGKKVFIFESHNLAPMAWFSLKSEISRAPALITLDRHTDTLLAFLRHHYQKYRMQPDHPYVERIRLAQEFCAKIKTYRDVEQAVTYLRNDEHIDFAIRAGILSHAYVISHETNPQFITRSEERRAWDIEQSKPENWMGRRHATPPHDATYILPENRIISLDNDYSFSDREYSEKEKIDLALDDLNLKKRMELISIIESSIFPGHEIKFDCDFILDVDLDYFNTRDSINPKNSQIFYRLIRNCVGISIAKETDYVNRCRLKGESVTANELLKKMIKHIESAQS